MTSDKCGQSLQNHYIERHIVEKLIDNQQHRMKSVGFHKDAYVGDVIQDYFILNYPIPCLPEKRYSQGQTITINEHPVELVSFTWCSEYMDLTRCPKKLRDNAESFFYLDMFNQIQTVCLFLSRRVSEYVKGYNDVLIYSFPLDKKDALCFQNRNGVYFSMQLFKDKWDIHFDLSVLLGFLVFDDMNII